MKFSFDLLDAPLEVPQKEEEKPRKKEPPLPRTNLRVAPPALTSYNNYITKNTEIFTEDTTESTEFTLRLVLLGQKNSGKSCTGDMILGASKFTSENTKKRNILQEVTRNNGKLKLVEIPGIRLAELSSEEYKASAIAHLMSATHLLEGEPDAFIYVISIANDINKELKLTDFIYRRLRKIMSKIVVVFTNYDTLHTRNISRYDFLESLPDKFKTFVKDCGCEKKIVFFENNRHFVDIQVKTQVRRLLNIII